MNTSLSTLFVAKTFVLIAGSALLLGATQVARAADAFISAAAISIGAGGAFEAWRLLGQATP